MIPKNENMLKIYDFEVSGDSLNSISQILIWRIYWWFRIFYVNSSNYARTIPRQQCFFHGCRWYALRLIHKGSREIPSHRKLMILRFQVFLRQLLIDLDLVHRLVISDLLSWSIKPCKNYSKVSIFFVGGCRWYALRLIRNGSREIPPRRFCSAAYRYESGTMIWNAIMYSRGPTTISPLLLKGYPCDLTNLIRPYVLGPEGYPTDLVLGFCF